MDEPLNNVAIRRDRKIVTLLCLLAAIHVFVFSATFPFFNCVDEQAHFDLVLKYAHGNPPHGPEMLSPDSLRYMAMYHSLQFLGTGEFPPPLWTQPITVIAPVILTRESEWKSINHESGQPPLYYALAGLWWDLGRLLGLDGGRLLYWLRFLNILFIVVLVWIGYFVSREIFPDNNFPRLGVPALIAFIPQTAFYSIQNDVLSPVCFGAAFFYLIKFCRAETPSARLGILVGLSLAATFLTKISNLPLLAASLLIILFKIIQMIRSGKINLAIPSLIAFSLCVGVPVAAWLAWCKYAFGDFTGTAAKIQALTWTLKPFGEWFHHPVFTPQGFGTFMFKLTASFWQSDFVWHNQTLGLPWVDMVYVIISIIFIGVALLDLSKSLIAKQRHALLFGFGCYVAAIAFFGFLSIIYDFHDCPYPSREYPYFTSGRLMLGALIPFLLLFVYGIDRALKRFGIATKFSVLTVIVLYMLITEITIDWPIFPNAYNWFHM